jgi:hypothetical protein
MSVNAVAAHVDTVDYEPTDYCNDCAQDIELIWRV